MPNFMAIDSCSACRRVPLDGSPAAATEPTRRLLALAGRGAFCVSEFTEILSQSQPLFSVYSLRHYWPPR